MCGSLPKIKWKPTGHRWFASLICLLGECFAQIAPEEVGSPLCLFLPEPHFVWSTARLCLYTLIISHSANGPWKKSLNFIFPTKYVIPKSLKFSHWLSEICGFCSTKQHSVPKNDRLFAPQVKQLGQRVNPICCRHSLLNLMSKQTKYTYSVASKL